MTTNYLQATLFTLLSALLFVQSCDSSSPEPTAEIWLTTPDQTLLFEKQDSSLIFQKSKEKTSQIPVILIDSTQKYQVMDGFGYTLTGGSAIHLNAMNEQARQSILHELFGTDSGSIGVSYLRISIGASDLSDHVFSYDDLAEGQTDPALASFSIETETKDLIPVLKEILAIAPDIPILGSPWSPPKWMKSNHDSKGGSLLPEFYDTYAQYFVKYIQAMAKEGIAIDAITIQNEPLHPGNEPSLLMLPEEQATFIKDHLGPAFKEAKINTKIILYDHNLDRPDYPISIMNDSTAKKYVDGSAFHLYAGDIETMEEVHQAHPDKNIYFTEQWVGGNSQFADELRWHVQNLIIGAPRHWSKNVLEWNLAANTQLEPHTDRGGCTQCLGALTIDGDQVKRNVAYYIIAHASKFVRPGSIRIGSSLKDESLPNVAFQTTAGQLALIVLNTAEQEKSFLIRMGDKEVSTSLPAGSVATYVW